MKPGSSQSSAVHRICRIYAVLLCAYPRAFRMRFGGEMQQIFRDRCRKAVQDNDLPLFVLLMIWDWLGTSLRERLAALRNLLAKENHEVQGFGAGVGLHLRTHSWWLLALCGLFDAICAWVIFFTRGPDGSLILRTSVNSRNTLENLGLLALAAGACAIAAGLRRSRNGRSWLVVLNGLASAALGVTLTGALGSQIGFHTLALLVVAMALSLGIHELSAARALRHRTSGRLLLFAAGVVSIGFAIAFLAFALGWIVLHSRPLSDFLWFGSYFGFTALCMLGLALQAHGSGPHANPWAPLPADEI